MKKQIISSIIAKNQQELKKRIKKIINLKRFQLDVMDGKFVSNKSLLFNFELPRLKKYEAHLMIKNPEKWINKNYKKVDTIIFHIESTKNPLKIIKLIKNKKKNVGIALNPKTSINEIKPYLKNISLVLIMTVNPGKYGAKFLSSTLIKIEKLRKIKKDINIEVDGGINSETIIKVNKAGANLFVVGSYFQKSVNIKKDINKLKKIVK